MQGNYLKKHYFDDAKLAQRARLEFYRAIESGRMIAFNGSMTTQAFGYGEWKELHELIVSFAESIAGDYESGNIDEHTKNTFNYPSAEKEQKLTDLLRKNHALFMSNGLSVPVALSLVEDVLKNWIAAKHSPLRGVKHCNSWPLDLEQDVHEALRVRIAQHFRLPKPEWAFDNRQAGGTRPYASPEHFDEAFHVGQELWKVGIRRFSTTNYDFELERVAMLADRDPQGSGSPSYARKSSFELLRDLRDDPSQNFSWDLGSGRIRRTFDDGWAIESDLLNRERIDRLIEFAVGTDDVDGHIMHIHGRACNWRSMILTQTDYDRLYRRDDLNRVPFEYARRIMMGGNPIVFVGLGMTEEELNQELREFVSNAQYQRVAPLFLLWSDDSLNASQIAAMRLKFLRNFGVLTIFSQDLPGFIGMQPWPGNLMRSLNRMIRTLGTGMASNEVVNPGQSGQAIRLNPAAREMVVGERWRSMKPRIVMQDSPQSPHPVVLWDSYVGAAQDKFRNRGQDPQSLSSLFALASAGQSFAIIGPQGCGKGWVSRCLASQHQLLGLSKAKRCLLINGGFGFDTDTILDAISHFFEWAYPTNHYDDQGRPTSSRNRQFDELSLSTPAAKQGKRLTIILNGAERFFDIAGNPLSAELDQFLNRIAECEQNRASTINTGRRFIPKVNLILLGTERIRTYVEGLSLKTVDFSDLNVTSSERSDLGIPNRYLDKVWKVAASKGLQPSAVLQREIARYRAQSTGKISGDSIELRKAFFGSLFDDISLGSLVNSNDSATYEKRNRVVLTRRILQKLAYIGLPVNYPILERLVHGRGAISPTFRQRFKSVIQELRKAHLVIYLSTYVAKTRPPGTAEDHGPDESTPERFRLAMHRSLLTELRYRYGIPLSEAKLSTAFNMSLYIAQPIDGDIPDTDIHEDLGQAIDLLIGSYRCPTFEGDSAKSFAEIAGKANTDITEYRTILHAVSAACGESRHGASQLDDAEAIALHRLCSNNYAEALRSALALVRSYYSTTGLLTLDGGDRILKDGHDGILLEHAERLDDLIDAYAKSYLASEKLREELTDTPCFPDVEPFYAEDLIWLHNERGVVRLAMGDLYEARRSFTQAHRINREHVERNDRAHNWRRITLNEIVVDIERGRLVRAQRKCEQIRTIMPPKLLREDKLALALIDGLEGWCSQLSGRTEQAVKHYRKADGKLAELGEVRAQAFFGRSLADALAAARDPLEDRHGTLERSLDLAQSARQMDIVHRLQLSRADSVIFGATLPTELQRAEAIRHVELALSYALHTEVHRVRCEASMLTARIRLAMADFEGALRFATDAMMVASRYGMELRKISLRALIAEIMAARGHPVTAERLARTCIKMATRRRFQTAIDKASRVLAQLPKMSSAIVHSDHSGRRHF